jgi:hypothetical protein
MKVTHCDVCDCSIAKSISFVYDRTMDAAGSMSDDSYDVDLCVECEVESYRRLISKIPELVAHDRFTVNATIINIIKSMLKTGRLE